MVKAKTNWIDLGDKFKCDGPLGYAFIYKKPEVESYKYGKAARTIRIPHSYTIYDKEHKIIEEGEYRSFHGCRVRVSSLLCGYDARSSRDKKQQYIANKTANTKPMLTLTAIDSQLILDAINNLTKAINNQTDITQALLNKITPKAQ